MSDQDLTIAGADARPLSHRQKLIWAGQMLDPDVPLYNMAHAFTIESELNVHAFQHAFAAMVAGSDALRTVVEPGPGSPTQRVLPSLDWPLTFVDLSGADDQVAAVEGWIEARSVLRFDLSERLFDSALLRLGPARYVWFLNQHHLITDAWSVSLMLRRQGELYQLAIEGRLDEADAFPQYQDFLDSETDGLGSKGHQRSQAHWQQRLDRPPEPLDFYGRRPAEVGPETVRVTAAIEGERAQRLTEFLTRPEIASLSPELTALRFFQTVLFAYLHRISGSDRIVVGTPFHNRAKRKAKQTIGLFMNLFPVAANVESDQTMVELSEKLGAEIFDSMQHAAHPIDADDENGAFEVVLNYLHIPYENFGEHQVEDRWIHCGAGDRSHSLRLQVRRHGDSNFRLYFDVKTALFDEPARHALVRNFLQVLDGWLDDVDVPIGVIDLLTAEERERLIIGFNRSAELELETPPLSSASVVADFEAAVALAPEAVAIEGQSEVLDYGELNRRANIIAHRLLDGGIGSNDYVGVLLPRGPDAVAAVLGILKAGAAYLPIEPDTPEIRLTGMLADTATRIVCTDASGLAQLDGLAVTAVVVDELVTATTGDELGNPAVEPGPDDTAYVIFTSGSTGRPKGVPVHHRGLGNYVSWARRHYSGDGPKVFALFTSLAFDLTITSIFVPLTSGGSIIAYPDDTEGANPSVVQVWRDNRVDVLKLTPSHLAIVRQLGLTADRLEAMIVGGEDFTTDLASAIQELHPTTAIYNEYGPTETVVGCMIHRFDPADDHLPSVPIGEPAANAEIFLLDRKGIPVPPGVIGEIHVGGPGVSDGYLAQPDITAKRFVARPPSLAPEKSNGAADLATLYRTGDLGRWRFGDDPPRLEFLGRADDQIKLRGYRIELGEIEAALTTHASIESAAVVVATETVGAVIADPATVIHCSRCGLPSNFPDATFSDGVCSLCQDYDSYRHKVDEYFRDLDQLRELALKIKADRPVTADGTSRYAARYDCVVLLSGGKDSTYMLYQVVALGLTPLVFTLDNGFISPSALANCRRVCEHLGVDLEIGSTEHMNEIFRDSLDRFANVCNGCFKTIYTLSMNLARQHGLGYIVTGLARGQLFETRLSDMYNHRIFDVDQIDTYILEARKAYHHLDDAVSQNLDVSAFEDDRIFDEVQFVDFYRYADVALEEVMGFLSEHTPWERPPDTGRSTNCLINDVGIYVHNRERGFHNYALPYSWDVRLGHKVREAALDELDDDLDHNFVNEVLVEIGYKPKPPPQERQTARLIAHYQAPEPRSAEELREALGRMLPEYMIPTTFVHHQRLPLTSNGKIDRANLMLGGTEDQAAEVDITTLLAEDQRAAVVLRGIWSTIFDAEVGYSDNFFDLGGDSIIAIQIVDRAASAGLALTPRQLFEAQTVAGAAVVSRWDDGEPVAEASEPASVALGAGSGSAGGPTGGESSEFTPGDGRRHAYPLTPTQSGMLFHTLAEPGSGVYEGQIVHRLRGEVDPEILERCWRELVARHDILRTLFRWQGTEQPTQVVAPDARPGFTFRDWTDDQPQDHRSGGGPQGPDDRLDAFLAADRAAGFDLTREPALRLALLRMPAQHGQTQPGTAQRVPAQHVPDRVMVWSFHHIALDGWSIALAMNELLDSYQSAVDGTGWEPPSRHPFVNYVDWLAEQSEARAEAFWRAELSSFRSTTALPRSSGSAQLKSDERPAEPDDAGRLPYGAGQRQIDGDRSAALLDFASSQRVTLSTVLQAAWGLVLARYEGSEDVMFGVTTSGRPATLPGAEHMVGMLVTTLPARIRIDGRQSPGQWLRRIQDGQLAVREHEYASLVDVQRWSELSSGQALFNSILVIENFPDYEPPASAEAVAIESRAYRVQSNYPLSLIVLPGPELTIKAVYDPTRFDGETIEEILDHVEAAIGSLAAGTADTVDQLTMVCETETDRLNAWSEGRPLDEEPELLPDLIRRHGSASPDSVAVACGDEELTYGQLRASATELATELRAAGVGPDAFVGILLDRSVEMVVAITGVLEAGGAYLPLDPSYPRQRLRFMVEDAGARLVISTADTDTAGLLGSESGSGSPQPVPGSALTITRTNAGIGTDSGTEPSRLRVRDIRPDDTAYLIYTSGSTGRPNGVPIHHGNLAASTAARFGAYRHQPESFLLLSSFSFDSSIVGIFWTLAAGGRLVLPLPGQELDMSALGALIKRQAVTHTLCLPSLYRLLLDFVEPAALETLTTIIVAGEACPRDLVKAHASTLPTATLHNEYGPTEASVWCTVHACSADGGGPVPIGRPIPGAAVAVLDDGGRPSGIGVPGEIHVAGNGLAAGYHNRPRLTAERFVEIDGRRWFRTRDVGTVDADGRIEFGGRADSQVKIRGFRVELGEVEAAVGQHPAVDSAVAIVASTGDRVGDQLIAFVEPAVHGAAGPGSRLESDVPAWLKDRLPDAFVPSRIVVVDPLPRLPNGKVDRSRLPAIEVEIGAGPGSRSPETDQERLIAGIWEELLPGVSFGVDDDFFDVGGHSLLAVSLVEQIRRATGADLPLAALLDAPTVSDLARLTSVESPDVEWRCLVALRESGSRVPLYLIPPAGGTALSFRGLSAMADPDQPLYCFEPVGADGTSEPHDAVEAMAEHYLQELRLAQPDGHYRIGGSCLGAIVAWEMAQRLQAAGTPADLLVFLDPGPPHSGPGWSYKPLSQRSLREHLRSAVEIVADGNLPSAVKAVWRRNRYQHIGRVHYRAQLSYVAARLRVPILWLQSAELNKTEPVFLERWRILAGDDLTPIVIPGTTHGGLMTSDPAEVRRLSAVFNRALAEFDGLSTAPSTADRSTEQADPETTRPPDR